MKRLKNKTLFSAIFTFLLCMAIFTTIKLVNVDAMGESERPLHKYYTSYEVQPGDTLTTIAIAHTQDTGVSVNSYVDEVIDNNGLSSDSITSGKNIIIAYYSEENK